MVRLTLDTTTSSIWSEQGRFDVETRSWTGGVDAAMSSDLAEPLSATAATGKLAQTRRLLPVGVIGLRAATTTELATARSLGASLAQAGFPVMTGGKNGIMEAASQGAVEAGGLTIGILPDTDWTGANPYITIPIATGFGSARNAIIARACFALVAVGGEYGTQTEMAFGMHFGRLVLGLGNVPSVTGVIACANVDEAVERVSLRFLALDGEPGPDQSDDGIR